MNKSVSDRLVETLVQAGVKRVYAITGDSLSPVNDAIRRDGRLEWIHVRHEESATYAASMDTELNGIGYCMSSSGPGHMHLTNGLYDANCAGNPVIAIANICAVHKFGIHWFQETNPFLFFRDRSKYVYVANTPKQFATTVQRATRTAINKKGVAILGLPGDVAGADLREMPTATQTFLAKPVARLSGEKLSKLAAVLNGSKNKKIVLYCGHGCQHAVEEVEQLAETLRAPIVVSFRGKISFDRADSPHIADMNGLLEHSSGYDACAEADALVTLGTDLPYAEFLPKKSTIIQIDERPDIIGRRVKVDYDFVGDIKDSTTALLPKLNARTDDGFLKDIYKEHLDLEKSLDDYTQKKTEEKQIDPEYAIRLLDKYAANSAIFTADTGMNVVWAARFIKGIGKRYLTGSFNHGSMAGALLMATGAAASAKGRQVVAMCGDDGLSVLLGGSATLIQHQYLVKILVFNNRSPAMVKLEMEVSGYLDWQTNMVNPPFDKLAEPMSVRGYEVTKTEDPETIMKAALEHDGPTLVNIYTNRDTLATPSYIAFEQMKGFVVSIIKKIDQGDFAEAKGSTANNTKHIKDIF